MIPLQEAALTPLEVARTHKVKRTLPKEAKSVNLTPSLVRIGIWLMLKFYQKNPKYTMILNVVCEKKTPLPFETKIYVKMCVIIAAINIQCEAIVCYKFAENSGRQ